MAMPTSMQQHDQPSKKMKKQPCHNKCEGKYCNDRVRNTGRDDTNEKQYMHRELKIQTRRNNSETHTARRDAKMKNTTVKQPSLCTE